MNILLESNLLKKSNINSQTQENKIQNLKEILTTTKQNQNKSHQIQNEKNYQTSSQTTSTPSDSTIEDAKKWRNEQPNLNNFNNFQDYKSEYESWLKKKPESIKKLEEYEKQKELEKKYRENIHKAKELIKSSGVPKIFSNFYANDFTITQKNKIAVNCLQAINSNKGFYIYGECGTGKTMLASIILNEKAKLSKPSLFISAVDIYSELNPS